MKLWLPPTFLRGRYVVAFSLRGRASGPGPLASLSVAQLSQGRTLDEVATQEWTPPGDGTRITEVAIPVEVDREPVKLQARILYHGQGTLDIDKVSAVPDVRRSLAERMEALRELLPAGVAPVH